jgi:hypothetical protein
MSNTIPSRRWFLHYFTDLVIAALGVLVALPALAYIWAPLRRRPSAEGPGASGLPP